MVKHIRSDERGIASIIITMFMMGIISLVVLGFAQLARHEQQNSLNTQLSTEALYAAQSGVNAATKAITDQTLTNDPYNQSNAANPNQDKTGCGADGIAGSPLNAVGSLTTANVQYSCLLITQKLPTVNYQNVGSSTVIPLNGVDSANNPVNINKVTVSWGLTGNDLGGNIPPAAQLGEFPPNTPASWPLTTVGLLRVDLVPIPTVAPVSFTRSDLDDNTFTAFLYPIAGGTGTALFSDAAGATKQGKVIDAKCDGTLGYKCHVTIDTSALTYSSYYMRVKPVYSTPDFSVCVNGCSVATPTLLAHAQAEIDSTGKAQDILRRVRVRIPNDTTGVATKLPDFALDSVGSICKQLVVWPGGANPDLCP